MVLALGLIVGGYHHAQAQPSSEDEKALPAAHDEIWLVFDQLPRPDDSSCATVVSQIKAEKRGTTADQELNVSREMCNDLAQMPNQIYAEMSAEGMFNPGRLTTDLRNVSDWRAVQNLTFDHGDGMIQFTQPINFMSRDFMIFMNNFGEVMESRQNFIELDADIVEDLKNRGAILTMRNVSDFIDPVIAVDGQGDTEGIISGFTYDRDNNTITFNAAHFTTFQAIERTELSSLAPPKITRVKARKYTSKSGKEKIRLSIYGKNFKKKSKVKLGSKKAYKVRKKRDGKIIAFFSMKEVKKLGHKKLSVKVINPNGSSKTYRKKVKIKKIKLWEKQ